MKKKSLAIVSLDVRAGRSYGQEVRALFEKYVDVTVYHVEDGSAMGVLPAADLFAISTDAYGSAEEVARHVPMECQTMAVETSFRWSDLHKLKEIPAGEKVLFVNMTQAMAREAITQLNQFGVNHLRLIPFYPGAALEEDVKIAVTPDEMRYVPPGMDTVIDLGQRACTSGMMIEIALRLGLEFLLETQPFQDYFRGIAANNYSFDQMFARSIRLESQFHILMEILTEGVIGVNERGEIFACSQRAQDITRVTASMVMGKRGEQVFPYIGFDQCLRERRRVEARVEKLHGANISVEVVPVLRQEACVGAFALLERFDEVEKHQGELRRQLLNKGHYAKYGFDDVVGQSQAILRAKGILNRMAASESPVLLIGETGTGKELFAHALHRASRRSRQPFVAINVAAFPENLLESELFGYEEGAFTGAKKGGKPGLLELAHRGTLFLDEVEGMSPILQVKLLRVLQEREIMRVGGSRIISIDVRIVAATNESLEEKVEEGSFRRDLYYRLNTLPIQIPPLSQREDDVFLLIDHFKDKLGGRFALDEPVRRFLADYPWPGNIRELRNVVEYFIYTGQPLITLEELPPTVWHKGRQAARPAPMENTLQEKRPPEVDAAQEGYWFVVEQLYLASEAGGSLGRDKLLAAAKARHVPLSQSEARGVLQELARAGYAKVSRGRGGSALTLQGRALWEGRRGQNRLS